MVAEILPLRALPRGLAFFSYAVPAELQPKLQLGQCVKIPFQKSEILGVVGKISRTNNTALKSITEIVNPVPLISSDYLQFLEELAFFYGVSLATVLKRALPPIQPSKIKAEIIKPLTKKKSVRTTPDYGWYKTNEEHTAALSKYTGEKLLIIVPEVKDLLVVKNALPAERKNKAIVHGEANQKNERELWFAIRNDEVETVIATRGALWWPIQNFDRIIIDFEHDEQHKHADQAPRFTTKDLAKLQAKRFGLQYTELSYSPSVSSYFFIQEKRYQLITEPSQNFPAPTIVYRDAGNNQPVFTPTLNAIKLALENGDCLLIYNQTKPGKFGFCRDCSRTVEAPLPELCPYCGGIRLVQLGHTINSVAKFLQTELGSDAEIITFDKTSELPERTKPRVLVGTWALLRAVNYDTIKLVAILDFTRQVMFPDYLSQENLRHRIRQLQFFCAAPLFIQSETEHPLLLSLTNDTAWYNRELQERAGLSYPPYAYLVRYLVPGASETDADIAAKKIKQVINQALTKTPKKLIIQGPIAANARFQNKAWAILMLKITEPDILAATTWANQFLSTPIKIDPNPISLTSPH